MKLYLAVTNDRYELPVYVCDSADELSYLTGTKKTTILETLARGIDNRPKKRKKRKYLFKRVICE